MNSIKNLSLNLKIILLGVILLMVLFIVTVSVLAFNTRRLTEEIAYERINEEITITQEHLSEIEKQLSLDVSFVASSVPFVQAVGRRSADATTELINSTNTVLEMDDIDVFDGDGKKLSGLNSGDDIHSDNMIKTALGSKPTVGVIAQKINGKITLAISAAAPVVSLRQTSVLGAVQMGRNIDSAFLQKLTFRRQGVILGLVYNDQFQARNLTEQVSGKNILYQNVAFNPESVRAAAAGQTVIANELSPSSGVPYAVAYIPLKDSTANTLATLMIVAELREVSNFQNNTLLNTISVFAVVILIAILIYYLALQRIAILPLTALKTAAQKLTGGDYDQRIPGGGRDEIGQLGLAFNEMAEAIQNRELNLQKARAQAERSDKVKSAFLANMSHELRTPLNAVINFTSFVAEGDVGPVSPQQSELLREVIASGKHLLSLINDVLDMSKIEAGSLRLFIEDSVNLNAIINNVAATGRVLLANKPVQLKVEVQDNLTTIRADKQRVLQILLNLISNACKFTEQGEIKLRAVQKDDEIIISVSDTGPGIAPEDQSLVFEAFKQTATGLRQGGGTGLGMPIARKLAEAHNGRLWLVSEFGKGTTFYVALPIKSEELALTLA